MKIPLLGRVHKRPVQREDCLNRRLEQFGKKEGMVVLRGVDTPIHTLTIRIVFLNKIE